MQNQPQTEPSDEQDPRSRTLPVSLLAIAALIGAIALVLQRAAGTSAVVDDPFPERLTAPPDDAAPAPDEVAADPSEARLPSFDATELSFPETLGDGDERSTDSIPPELSARLPAALSAIAPGHGFSRALRQDPLVALAMRASGPKRNPAAEGGPGAFVLHVISYDHAEHARAFAQTLRERGHAAFVESADVRERGRSYRVRIGPFPTQKQAEAYRRRFELEEQMNTVVLKTAQPVSNHP